MAKKTSITRIAWPDALDLIESTRTALHHLPSDVEAALGSAREMFRVHLLDDERFLALLWPDVYGSRLLTPPDEPRTLDSVARRLMINGWSFDLLSEDMGLQEEQHDPVQFGKCRYIDENFDYERLGVLMLAPMTDDERMQSPGGSFFIYDGYHRSLVLAWRLLAGEAEYVEVPALLMVPRPK